jgi:hypothetical protein
MRSPSAASMCSEKISTGPALRTSFLSIARRPTSSTGRRFSRAQVQEVEGVEAAVHWPSRPEEAMKVGQALGAVSYRLAIQHEISRELAQCRRERNELGGPVPAIP